MTVSPTTLMRDFPVRDACGRLGRNRTALSARGAAPAAPRPSSLILSPESQTPRRGGAGPGLGRTICHPLRSAGRGGAVSARLDVFIRKAVAPSHPRSRGSVHAGFLCTFSHEE